MAGDTLTFKVDIDANAAATVRALTILNPDCTWCRLDEAMTITVAPQKIITKSPGGKKVEGRVQVLSMRKTARSPQSAQKRPAVSERPDHTPNGVNRASPVHDLLRLQQTVGNHRRINPWGNTSPS